MYVLHSFRACACCLLHSNGSDFITLALASQSIGSRSNQLALHYLPSTSQWSSLRKQQLLYLSSSRWHSGRITDF